MAKKDDKIKISKEDIRPRERAPILPTKKFEDKTRKTDRHAKHKKDPLRNTEGDLSGQ